MAAEVGPAPSGAVVERVAQRRIGARGEELLHDLATAGLRGEVEGRHPFPVRRAAEGATAVGIGTELEQATDRRGTAVEGGPRESGAAVGIGVEPRAQLDEDVERLDSSALCGPDQRLVEDLLRVVGRLPGGEAAVGEEEAT